MPKFTSETARQASLKANRKSGASEEVINITELEKAGQHIVAALRNRGDDIAAAGAQDDIDSVAILLTLDENELSRQDVQWIICHLLTHIVDDTEGLEGDVLQLFEAVESLLTKRQVNVICPYLQGLFDEVVKGLAPSGLPEDDEDEPDGDPAEGPEDELDGDPAEGPEDEPPEENADDSDSEPEPEDGEDDGEDPDE